MCHRKKIKQKPSVNNVTIKMKLKRSEKLHIAGSKHRPFGKSFGMIDYICTFLSALIILSCFLIKVPQINHVRQTKSGQGIYIQAMLMEILSFTTITLYNFTSQYSVMTYMEYPIILMQIYVLLFYTLKYKNMLNTAETLVGLTLYVFLTFAFVVGLFPQHLLFYALPFCTPISSIAKVTYIYGMLKHRNANAISLATWYISVGTNLARVFTVYVDSKDFTLMMNLIISSLLSAGVLLTAIYYKGTSGLPSASDISDYFSYIISFISGAVSKPEQNDDQKSNYPHAPDHTDNIPSYVRQLPKNESVQMVFDSESKKIKDN